MFKVQAFSKKDKFENSRHFQKNKKKSGKVFLNQFILIQKPIKNYHIQLNFNGKGKNLTVILSVKSCLLKSFHGAG